MGTVVDMHVHTIVGSMDSDISPKRLGEQAQAVGLTGIALTEHLHPWPDDEVEHFRGEYGLFVFNAREWTTDMGHVTTFGLPREVRGIHRARDLRNICDDYGAYFVICHPFRYFPGPSSLLFGHRRDQQSMPLEELAEHPVFSLADAIEVLNGGCIDRENRLALEVSLRLGKPQTAQEAEEMLRRLSGRTHHVTTGVVVAHGRRAITLAGESTTAVRFRTLSDREITRYVASGEPMDKAGAYGIQGRAALFVERLEGDYFAVVGLPLARLARMLESVGVPTI